MRSIVMRLRKTPAITVGCVLAVAGCGANPPAPERPPNELHVHLADAGPGEIQFAGLPEDWRSIAITFNDTPGIVGLGSRHEGLSIGSSSRFGTTRTPALPLPDALAGRRVAPGDAVLTVTRDDQSELVFQTVGAISLSASTANVIDVRQTRRLNDSSAYPHWWRPPGLVQTE